jgi:transcriptional regulator with XRE-family HTH domain
LGNWFEVKFAKKFRRHLQTISKYESGANRPNEDDFWKLVEVLNVGDGNLLGITLDKFIEAYEKAGGEIKRAVLLSKRKEHVEEQRLMRAGDMIKYKREMFGMTQRGLARRVIEKVIAKGGNKKIAVKSLFIAISEYESGAEYPTKEMAEEIGEILGIPELWVRIVKEKIIEHDRNDSAFNNLLWQARTLEDISLRELGLRIERSAGIISMYESGVVRPSEEVLEKLIRVLNINDANPLGITVERFRRAYFRVGVRGSVLDTAMTSAPDQASTSSPGGIDLTPANMNLPTKMDSRFRGNDKEGNGNDNGIQFHLDPAMLKQLQNAPGFVPVIINIQPLTDIRTFLEK